MAALTTSKIVGTILLPDGTVLSDSYVNFQLDGFDTDAVDDVTVPQVAVRAYLDPVGALDVDLWPNERGARDTLYSVRIGAAVDGVVTEYSVGKILVPAVGPTDINDLLPLIPPADVTVDQYLAQLSAAVASATASADSAAADATVAADAVSATAKQFDTVALLFSDAVLDYTNAPIGSHIRVGNRFEYVVVPVTSGTHDVETAGGVWMDVVPREGWVNPDAFGAIGDGVFNNDVPMQKALYSGYNVEIGSGTYLTTTEMHFPDIDAWGDAWDESNPFKMRGSGAGQTILHSTVTSGYAYSHTTINGTTPRGQNGVGFEFSSIQILGPQGWTSTSWALGISNCRLPIIQGNAFRGFASGGGIHIYAHSRGGVDGARIRDNQFGLAHHTIVGGNTVYDQSITKDTTLKFGIWLDGPNDTVGKVTDTVISDNIFHDFLGAAVLVKSHGATPALGGCANTTFIGNAYGAEASNKVEEGTVSGFASATDVTLRTTAGTFVAADYTGYLLAMRDTANGFADWEFQKISTWTDATRTAIVVAAFVTPMSATSEYRIVYCDAELEWLAQLGQFPTRVYLETGSYEHSFVADRGEETNTTILIGEFNQSGNVIVLGGKDQVAGGRGIERADGVGYMPAAGLSSRPWLSSAIPVHSIAKSQIIGDYDFPSLLAAGHIGMLVNATGGPIQAGNVVARDHTNPTQIVAATHLTNYLVIPEMNGKTEWADGEVTPVQTSGHAKIRIDGAQITTNIALKDIIYMNTSGNLKRISSVSASITPQINARQVGRADQTMASVVGTPLLSVVLGRG